MPEPNVEMACICLARERGGSGAGGWAELGLFQVVGGSQPSCMFVGFLKIEIIWKTVCTASCTYMGFFVSTIPVLTLEVSLPSHTVAPFGDTAWHVDFKGGGLVSNL